MAAKKTPKKQSKFAFIRNQPLALSAAEVVAKYARSVQRGRDILDGGGVAGVVLG